MGYNMVTVSNSNIIKVAKNLKQYVEKNKSLPSSITIDKQKFTNTQCCYLFTKFIGNPTKNYKLINVNGATNPTGQKINEKIYVNDYRDMAKRTSIFIEANKKLPNYVLTKKSKTKTIPSLYTYAFAKIVVYYANHKALPNYCLFNYKDVQQTQNVSKKTTGKYGHATKNGCDNMGQNNGYYCGCHSLQEVFRNLTGKVIPQSTIASVAGTTTSGTDHQGLNTAVAWFNKKYGYNLQVEWKNLSDIGWSGVKKIIDSNNQDCVVHNLYRSQWGHYEVINKVSSDNIKVQNSLGDKCTSSCYCGYVENRSPSEFKKYISGISQKSIMIITKK